MPPCHRCARSLSCVSGNCDTATGDSRLYQIHHVYAVRCGLRPSLLQVQRECRKDRRTMDVCEDTSIDAFSNVHRILAPQPTVSPPRLLPAPPPTSGGGQPYRRQHPGVPLPGMTLSGMELTPALASLLDHPTTKTGRLLHCCLRLLRLQDHLQALEQCTQCNYREGYPRLTKGRQLLAQALGQGHDKDDHSHTHHVGGYHIHTSWANEKATTLCRNLGSFYTSGQASQSALH